MTKQTAHKPRARSATTTPIALTPNASYASALADAVFVAQILLLLGAHKHVEYRKGTVQLLSFLRSHAEDLLVALLFSRDEDVSSEIRLGLANLRSTLHKLVSHAGASYLFENKGVWRNLWAAFLSFSEGAAHFRVVDKEMKLKHSDLFDMVGCDHRVGELKSAFGSIVRNSNWTAVAVAFNLQANESKLISNASNFRGSAAGRNLLERHTSLFVGEKEAQKIVRSDSDSKAASDAVVITVSLDLAVLMQDPQVRSLCFGKNKTATRPFESILEEACRPTTLRHGDDPKKVGDEKIQLLKRRLDECKQSMQKDVAEKKKREEEAKKTKAIEELRKIGPLIDIIKSNPDIIKEI